MVPVVHLLFRCLCNKIAYSGCIGIVAHHCVADLSDSYGMYLDAQNKHGLPIKQCPVVLINPQHIGYNALCICTYLYPRKSDVYLGASYVHQINGSHGQCKFDIH